MQFHIAISAVFRSAYTTPSAEDSLAVFGLLQEGALLTTVGCWVDDVPTASLCSSAALLAASRPLTPFAHLAINLYKEER